MNDFSNSNHQPGDSGENSEPNRDHPKKLFGRGVYGSKDVPIRALDTVILVLILAAVVLTAWNAAHGGFTVTFDTGMTDTPVASQKIRYGNPVEKPAAPQRPGYILSCWSTEETGVRAWDFAADRVSSDMTLHAIWRPAEVTVKFDLNGGTVDGKPAAAPITVTFDTPYGPLPTPVREGYAFAGWMYGGAAITADTTVTATGEHVLSAQWD